MSVSFRAEQSRNKRRTFYLLFFMFVLVVAAIWAVAMLTGYGGTAWIVPLAVALALAGVWGSYWSSDKVVLAITHARVIDHDTAPQLFNVVDEMRIAAGLPMPKVAIVDDPAPNAFATGRDPDHAVIAFTTGILTKMDREELQGVAAHELAHIGNRDTLVMAVAATTAGLIAIVADIGIRASFFSRRDSGGNPVILIIGIVVLILAPLAALLMRSAVSRKRESLADATSVSFTRNPAGLRRALEALAADSTVVRAHSTAVAQVWIESPLDGKTRSLFDTHPPLAERIASLQAMEHSGPPMS